MLTEEEKRYLGATRLSVKVNYLEFEKEYDLDSLFYYFGNGIIISTISNETYIDKKKYKDNELIKLLREIFATLDTLEIVIPYDFLNLNIITKSFEKLKCNTLRIDTDEKITFEQLSAISNYSKIKELKVENFDKNIGLKKLNYKIIPLINKKFTSEKFQNIIFDDILKFKTLEIELPIKDDVEKDDKVVSEKNDLELIINSLVDIDILSFTLIDNGEKSIEQSKKIIDEIEKSIGSVIENIYYVTGNRTIENIEELKSVDENHKLCIMYNKDIICSLDDFICMRKYIDRIINKIKKYKLSPLERALMAYDMVKDFYIVNNKYMVDKSVSKYVHRLFKVNNINCQAYSSLYTQILHELKVNAADFMLYSPLVSESFLTKENHCRTMVYLNDEKYDINGLFSTDVVWDSIKKIQKKYNYEFFLTRAKNLNEQFLNEKYNNEINFLINNYPFEKLTSKDIDFFEELFNKSKIEKKNVKKIKRLLEGTITLKDFLSALSVVRVASGVKKEIVKEELLAIVNKINKKEKFVDNFSQKEDLSYLDISKK